MLEMLKTKSKYQRMTSLIPSIAEQARQGFLFLEFNSLKFGDQLI